MCKYILVARANQTGKLRQIKRIIGIVGTDGIAGAHAKMYARFPDNAEIVAGSDIVPGKAEAFLRKNNLQNALAFDSTEEMLDKVRRDAG